MKKILKSGDIIIFFLSLMLISLISSATTLYGDDFIYGTYFCGGFSEFLNKTAEHYMQMNGRAFIHFLLEIVLIFRDRLFFAVIPLMLIFVFFAYDRLRGKRNSRRGFYYALCFMGVMIIPVKIMREGILWMSGAFNYLFPVGMALIGFGSVKKAQNTGKIPLWLYPAAFLAGASTEQCGMIAIGSSVFYLIYEKSKKHRICKKAYLLILLMLTGFASVILSPGTSGRITDETVTEGMSILERLSRLFYTALSGKGALLIFTAAVLLCAAGLINKHKAFVGMTAVLCFGAVLLCFFENHLAGGTLLTIAILFAAVNLICFSDTPDLPIMLLAGAGSMGMLVFSSSFGFRNILPALLLFLCTAADRIDYYLRVAAPERKNFLLIICFLLSAAVFFPTLRGYCDNRRIINENLSQITHEGKGFSYNVDINPLYGYNQFYVDSFYYDGIKEIYGLSEDTKIFIYGRDFEALTINGKKIENPVYIKNNKHCYPLRGVIEALGGSAGWNDEEKCAVFTLNEKQLYVDFNNVRLYDKEKEYPAEYILTDNDYGNFFRSNIYLNDKGFSEIFGIDPEEYK